MIDRKDKKRAEAVESVLKQIKEHDIKFCWLQFLDLNGIMKSYGVRSTRMEDILESGEGFDGSSINGYGRLEESDMVGVPDPSTFAIVPWRTNEVGVARFLCDVYNPDESRYDGDPRYILKRAVDKATAAGYTYYCAPELEFFWLKPGMEGRPIEADMRGYFDYDHGDENQLMRREAALYASAFPNLSVETTHHEVAKSQHEIDIRYGPALDIADAATTMKMIIKTVGARHGFVGTFMPKPFFGHNGSGMHVHQSLWKDGENAFFDANGKNQVSDTLKYFIGGQLTHAKEMTAVLNSWPNSYKRLVPGYEAPTYIAWGFKNRSMMIRVPNFFNKKSAARCEIRSPDGAGNVYLQLATLLSAGLEGVTKKIAPTDPVELNIFHVSEEEKKRLNVSNLPGSLGDALDCLEQSKFMEEVLGKTAFNVYLDTKREEFKLANAQISEWELTRYSSKL